MRILMQQLIADFHERSLPDVTVREAVLPALSGKIDTVIGMRRTGKTFYLYQAMQHYLGQGAPKAAMLYINFDDERLLPLRVEELGMIHETYFRMFPEHRQRRCYFFFDEIQNVPGWEAYLRRLVDTENIQCVVSGSSAKLLSREIATGLRGRSISTEIFPFSFTESLRHEDSAWCPVMRPGSSKRAWLENRFLRYMRIGGFPEVQTLGDEHRLRILQDYVDVVILRDVVERYRVAHVLPLRYLIRHLLASPACMFSVNKFYRDLKSQGVSCSKDSLHQYLEYLMDAYLVYAIPVYSDSERVRRVNPRKIYCIDTGLANAFSHKTAMDAGRLLENIVFMTLRRKGLELAYYKTGDGYEVDFISMDHAGEQQLYQVSLHMHEKSTREREIRALCAAMQETGLTDGLILTLEDDEEMDVNEGKIRVMPVWLWCMQAIMPGVDL